MSEARLYLFSSCTQIPSRTFCQLLSYREPGGACAGEHSAYSTDRQPAEPLGTAGALNTPGTIEAT